VFEIEVYRSARSSATTAVAEIDCDDLGLVRTEISIYVFTED